MTALCGHPGCPRHVRKNDGRYSDWDNYCSEHDGYRRHGNFCHCLVSRPDRTGACVDCNKAFVGLMSPDNYNAAVEVNPDLKNQRADWTLRSVTT